jgi:YceI-like domain
MIRILSFVIILLLHFNGFSQKRFFSEKSNITFFSEGVIEEIKASNTKVTSILDLQSGEVAYLLSPKDFQFEKKLMQVHFNEKYMESEKFPRSTFKGKIQGHDASSTTLQQVKAVGQLSIHGVTRDVDIPGTLQIEGNTVTLKAKFMVKLIDYNIKVPQIVWQNIAQEVEVSVHFLYRPVTN